MIGQATALCNLYHPSPNNAVGSSGRGINRWCYRVLIKRQTLCNMKRRDTTQKVTVTLDRALVHMSSWLSM